VSVHAVLPASHLLLYLNDPHVAIPFAHRLCVTDQYCLKVSALARAICTPERGGWTFGRGMEFTKSGTAVMPERHAPDRAVAPPSDGRR
jgi:hypothetical protein